jgi:hypothetical protein
MRLRSPRLAAASLFVALLAAPGPVAAAPAPPTLLGAGSTTTNASSYSLGTRSFTAQHLYVAFLGLSETGGSVDASPGVTGGGTWTRVDNGEASILGVGVSAYALVPTSNAGSVALQTSPLSTVHEGFWYAIVEVSGGFDADTPVAQYRAAAASARTSFSVTLPQEPASDSLVLAAFAHGASQSSSPTSGWSELGGSDLSRSDPGFGAHVVLDASAPGRSPGSTWATSAVPRGVAIEIRSGDGPPPPPGGVTMVAAGDICRDSSACANTANRVLDVDPDFVATLGDLAYENGTLSDFHNRYGGGTTPETRWGRPAIKSITLPGYGNHDCVDYQSKDGCEDAVTYFGPDSSFGTDIAGTPGSYWAVKGSWLIVQLNSAGDGGSGKATSSEVSSQNSALQNILQADDHRCEIVIWHHPRYNSGGEGGSNTFIDSWFDTSYANGVDVVLSGHAHDYERFAPQDGNANARSDGVREFVVGTGGASLTSFDSPKPNSQVRISDYGILRMDLGDDETYSWAFLDDTSGATDDSGSASCHD